MARRTRWSKKSPFPQTEKALVPGNDYTIDAFSGRIFLMKPIEMHTASDSAIDTGAQQGNDVSIVVDYE